MNAQETAELLARECLVAFANPEKILFRTKRSVLLETIPLVELLNVAETAQDLSRCLIENRADCERKMFAALTTLRAKLPKGAL